MKSSDFTACMGISLSAYWLMCSVQRYRDCYGCTGRSGAAYSLFTREELAYLLDLHLFLSRCVQPAPVMSLGQAAAAAGSAAGDVSLYGTFPQVG